MRSMISGLYCTLCGLFTSFLWFQVNTDGRISFDAAILNDYTPSPLPRLSSPFIAPFWADVDTKGNNGRIYYRQTNTGGSPQFRTSLSNVRPISNAWFPCSPSHSRRHPHRSSCFCAAQAHQCVQLTHRQTDRQTDRPITLRLLQ